MKAYDIIKQLAQAREVERIVLCVTHKRRLYFELQDLVQIVYEALLNYDADKIEELHGKGLITHFIARIVSNQYYSDSSQYDYENRAYSRRTEEYQTEEDDGWDE